MIPGDFTESAESEKHALPRPAPSPTHLLLPSPHPISSPDSRCWGPKGPQTPFSPCLMQSYPERSRNCQDTQQRTEPKSADPRAAALFRCPHGLPIIRRGAQLSRARSVRGTRKLPRNLHGKCQAQSQVTQEVLGNPRKQGRSLPGLCEQVSMAMQQILCPPIAPLLAHCR